MVIISEEMAWDAEFLVEDTLADYIQSIKQICRELKGEEEQYRRQATGRYDIVRGLLQSDSVEAFMSQPQDVRYACYERVLRSSGFVRWNPSDMSYITLHDRAYDLFDHVAEDYFPPGDPLHPDYKRLVTETREYLFSNNAFEIDIGHLDEFLEIPGVHQWLRQITIVINDYLDEYHGASSADDVFLIGGERWQEHYNTIRTLLEDCEQLDWVLIQIWPEFPNWGHCVDEAVGKEKGKNDKAVEHEKGDFELRKEEYDTDDEQYDGYTDEDDMFYGSEDYYNEEDYMAYMHGKHYAKDDAKDNRKTEEDKDIDMVKSLTNTASYDWSTRRKIEDWLVAKRRAQDVIDMLKKWGPTISPLSSIVSRQLELFKKGGRAKQTEKLEDNQGKSRSENKEQQNNKRRPQRGVYVHFNDNVIYGYHNEAACHIGGGPALDSLTCCCWSNLGLDKEIRARNEDDGIILHYMSLQPDKQDQEEMDYMSLQTDQQDQEQMDARVLAMLISFRPRENHARTEYIASLKASNRLRPDLEAELRRLDFKTAGAGLSKPRECFYVFSLLKHH